MSDPIEQKTFDADGLDHIQRSSMDPFYLAQRYGISKKLVDRIQMGRITTFAEAQKFLAAENPNYLVKVEIRAETREQAAQMLRDMADTVLHSRHFRSDSNTGFDWSVRVAPEVAEHERQEV